MIIKYFHNLVQKFNLNDPAKSRIQKDYICYVPDKSTDSLANPKIHLIKNCPVGMIAYKIRKELEEITADQKIKEVLVIGEGRSCESLLKTAANQLKNYGFRNVSYRGDGGILDIKQDVVDAYKFISKDEASLLGWRILGNPDESSKEKHLINAKTLNSIISGTPKKLEGIKQQLIEDLEKEIEKAGVSDKDIHRDLLFRKLKTNNIHLSRPLCNLDITVCNILNSKGLGADVVFIIGFDQGRFPVKKEVQDNEIYQMLVAITRAKKRIYLINTVGKKVSEFIDCLENSDIDWEEIGED